MGALIVLSQVTTFSWQDLSNYCLREVLDKQARRKILRYAREAMGDREAMVTSDANLRAVFPAEFFIHAACFALFLTER